LVNNKSYFKKLSLSIKTNYTEMKYRYGKNALIHIERKIRSKEGGGGGGGGMVK
jgi:hypothetical protein